MDVMMRYQTLCGWVLVALVTANCAQRSVAISKGVTRGAASREVTALVPEPTGVDVLVLPAAGDPATTAPLVNRVTLLASDSPLCNLVASPSLVGDITNPTQVEFDDPWRPEPPLTTVCRVLMPPLTSLPSGSGYRAVAVLNATDCTSGTLVPSGTPCSSPRSLVAIPVFNIFNGPPPTTCTPTSVVLSVGSWSRNNQQDALGTVTYSLLKSTNPVTMLIVKLNGVVQGNPLTGSDLRWVAGSYYQLPHATGSYALTVEARDSSDPPCVAGADRPMTVNVK